jgi:hypothetical protein
MGGSCRELGHQPGPHALDSIPDVFTDHNRRPVHQVPIAPAPRRFQELDAARPQFFIHAIAPFTLDDHPCRPLMLFTHYRRGPP